MKDLILLLAILIMSVFAKAQTADITVKINGFDNNKGKAMIALYNSKSNFLKTLYKGDIVKINNHTATVVFKGIPTGKEYAVSLYHDENSNEELDTNFFGIPTEDYGCSNNAKGFMGPPKWKDAKFNLISNKTLEIQL